MFINFCIVFIETTFCFGCTDTGRSFSLDVKKVNVGQHPALMWYTYIMKQNYTEQEFKEILSKIEHELAGLFPYEYYK